ncbi:hypothetical protein ACH4EC_38270 [Streptomyces anulatus]
MTATNEATPVTTLDKGFLSGYFATDSERMETDFENCCLLVTNLVLDKAPPLLPVLEQATKAGVPLLVIAAGVEGEALNTLVTNKLRGIVRCCAVAVAGPDQEHLLDAAATAGGTQIVATTEALEVLKFDKLGRIGHAVVTRDTTELWACARPCR